MRVPFLVPLVALAVGSVAAQEGPPPYSVPFASAGNAIELVVGTPPDKGTSTPPLTVAVKSTPSWVRFETSSVETAVADGEPTARLAFDVDRSAPVGEPAVIILEVRSVSGVLLATHEVRLEVAPPSELTLGAPYPNPARGQVVLPFELPTAGRVRVEIYDALGRRVMVISENKLEPGAHETGLNVSGLASGPYVVRVLIGAGADTVQDSRRITVVR